MNWRGLAYLGKPWVLLKERIKFVIVMDERIARLRHLGYQSAHQVLVKTHATVVRKALGRRGQITIKSIEGQSKVHDTAMLQINFTLAASVQ